MAETVKKAKAPAKPRKPAAKKTEAKRDSVVEMPTRPIVSHEEISKLAHRYWIERGHQHGRSEEDWLKAEQELRGKAS